MKLDWIEYSKELWSDQPLPPVRRKVLVQVAAGSRPGMPPIVAVGYRKNAAGEAYSPYFVVPGVGGPVTHWADCLGDDFHAPLWSGRQPVAARHCPSTTQPRPRRSTVIPMLQLAAAGGAGFLVGAVLAFALTRWAGGPRKRA